MSEPTVTDFARSARELNGIVQGDMQKGAAVHAFDPDAAPQEKAAAAGKARDQLESVTGTGTNGEAKVVSVDAGKQSSIAPTIIVSDADNVQADEYNQNGDAATSLWSVADDTQAALPGAIPHDVAPSIPHWYRVGWRAATEANHDQADKTVLATFLSEQYYGDWYHNAAIIFFSIVASHFLTLFNMGWSSLLILLAFCSTYFSTSLARTRRRARDDIQRELVKTRLLSETESADWMNNFLNRFWLIYEPVLSATIISSADQILSVNTPPFLESVRLTTFTLGNKAPRIEAVRTFPDTEEDIVMMDWIISFTPADLTYLTPREAAKKINPKIVLSIRLGKGIATAAMPILLEDITFRGSMRIKLKLMTNFPHIQVIDLTFLEPPFIDYVLKPIGGEYFGFDIANVPGLSSFIKDMTHSTLGPMMYDPNVFTLNLEQLLSGAPMNAAIGVLQVTVHSARGLKVAKIGGGSPDPYVALNISQRAMLARTKHKFSTFNPTWHETMFLMIHSLTDTLNLEVMDHNEHRKDTEMGLASFELSKLEEDAKQEGLIVPVVKDGKQRGELRFDATFYPVLTPEKVDGVEQQLPDTSVGVVRLTIYQAKDLDATKSISGELNPFARVIIGSTREVIHNTKHMKHTNDPVWDSSTEFFCLDRASSIIEIKVLDDRDFMTDPTIGFLTVRLEDLLGVKKGSSARDWWPLGGCKTGRIRLGIEWKPLNVPGSLQGVGQYTPPIGLVRLWVQKAVDVKNVEAIHGGKSDPYVRVLLQSIIMARTEVINNELNPVWDQIIYVPVHSPKEEMRLECMDYQHLTRDRSLGFVDLQVSELVKESTEDKDYPFVPTGKKECSERIQMDKDGSFKGELHFVAEFVPAVLLNNVRFDNSHNEIRQLVNGAESHGGKGDGGSISSAESMEGSLRVTVTRDDATESAGVFRPGHNKGLKSTDTTHTADTTNTAATGVTSASRNTATSVGEPEDNGKYEGVDMSKGELLSHQSGIIVFNLISGRLAKKARLEVLLDDGYWPVVATTKSRSIHARFDHVGEGFLKELDFGRVWLRLNENDENEKECIIAECKIDAKAFLEQALDGPTKFNLCDQDEENESAVEIAAKYIPVNITLEPRESINNQGLLHIELIDGKDLLPADRSGKSDPFAIFTLNDQKVFRSQVKKKTLNPDWNEGFDISVASRVGSRFVVDVMDWNQVEQSKLLGSGTIDLESIEPFQGTTTTIPLSIPKLGNKGEIRIHLLFQPQVIVKSRKNTSTFSAAGRVMTQAGGIPLGAGKTLAQGVGSAGKTVKGVFKRDRAPSSSKASEIAPNGQPRPSLDGLVNAQFAPAPDAAPMSVPDQNPAVLPPAASYVATPSPSGEDRRPPTEYGMLKVTVLEARDLVGTSTGEQVKPYVVVKVGEKEQKTKYTAKTAKPEWDEMFRFIVGPETKSFIVTVIDHKTIGKDRTLGEAVVDVWNYIRPKGPPKDVWVELKEGQGQLNLRLEFERGRQGSLLSLGGSPPSSPPRFATLRKSSTRDRT